MFKADDTTNEQIGFLESTAAKLEDELTETRDAKERNAVLFRIADARARIRRLMHVQRLEHQRLEHKPPRSR